MRTKLINSEVQDVSGYGAGSGTVEIHHYECPCGEGRISEHHDNIPGFRDHACFIECDKCSTEWTFAKDRPVRSWRLEKKVPQK